MKGSVRFLLVLGVALGELACSSIAFAQATELPVEGAPTSLAASADSESPVAASAAASPNEVQEGAPGVLPPPETSPVVGGPQGEPEPPKEEPLPEKQPEPVAETKKATLKFGAGLILWYYQPFLDGAKSNVDTFFARITVDGNVGIWGLHLEPRFRDNTQRSFEFGPIFLQEAYLSAAPGPFTFKVGKSYSRLGLFWDNSFYGNVQVYDGLKLAPNYGVSLEAVHAGDHFALGYAAQFFLVDGRTNVSLPARDIVSVPNGRRRNDVIVRVDPELRFTSDATLRVGVSGEVFEAELPNGEPTVIRGALDAKLTLGALSAWGEYVHQRGRHVTDFPVPGTPATPTEPAQFGKASSDNDYYLAGGEYTYGWLTGRFNISYARYETTDVSERMIVPALGIKPVAELLLLTEYVYWTREPGGGNHVLDRSLNVTAQGYF